MLSTVFGGRRGFMSKQEFLERLRQALNGRVAPGVVTENINYYEDYINMEIRKGRSEEEVLTQLGDPRLIARTIVETNGGSQTQDGGRSVDSGWNSSGGYHERGTDRSMNSYGKGFRIPGWMILIVVLVAVVLVVSFVFSVLSMVLPVLLPILVVLFLVKLFRDWMN